MVVPTPPHSLTHQPLAFINSCPYWFIHLFFYVHWFCFNLFVNMNVLVFCQYSFVRFVQSFINHSFPCLFHIHSFSMFNFIPLKPDSRGVGGVCDAWVCVSMYCSKIWWILCLLIGEYICCIQTAYQAENKFMNKISDLKGHCGFFH